MTFNWVKKHSSIRPSVINVHLVYLCPAYGRSPIKFILPEFVSYLGERGVMCVNALGE